MPTPIPTVSTRPPIPRLRRPAGQWSRNPTDEELEQHLTESHLATEADLDAAWYPGIRYLSTAAAPRWRFLPRPDAPLAREYVYLPMAGPRAPRSPEARLFLSEWNLAWESAELRHDLLAAEVPSELDWLRRYDGQNLEFVPDGLPHRYYAHGPLLHLMTPALLERHGLPLLRHGTWPPFLLYDATLERVLPPDFDARLARAFAAHLWPHLGMGSALGAFSDDDPVRLLAHSLDYWMPTLDGMIRARALAGPRLERDDLESVAALGRARAAVPPGVAVDWPLRGVPLWYGEDEARAMTAALVNAADRHGRLRALLDAVRSNRVEDDFSPRWSFAREDFERRLYKKRQRRRVTFVELDDATPVHGAHAEVHEGLLWGDLMALVAPRDRRVVVFLRRGVTRVGDIARELGYKNHSPVSKALARIRRDAERLLGG